MSVNGGPWVPSDSTSVSGEVIPLSLDAIKHLVVRTRIVRINERSNNAVANERAAEASRCLSN